MNDLFIYFFGGGAGAVKLCSFLKQSSQKAEKSAKRHQKGSLWKQS